MLVAHRRTSSVALVLVVLGTTACAAVAGADNPFRSYGALILEVDNTQPSLPEMTVYIQAEQGGRWRLGTVAPNRRERFTFDLPGSRGRFRLVSSSPLARDRFSESFSVVPGSVVEWDVDLNRLTVMEPEPGG